VELLTVGGFSPLEGFMNKDAYEHVVQHMRCALTSSGSNSSSPSTARPPSTPLCLCQCRQRTHTAQQRSPRSRHCHLLNLLCVCA
jgi:hypothetical protein